MPGFHPPLDHGSRMPKREGVGRRPGSWVRSSLTSHLVFLSVFGLILFANESLFSIVLAAAQTVMASFETALSPPIEDASLTVLLPGAPT